MSFLQPAMLWAIPVIALPIIIHLINQRRFQTIRWGAMMFLLQANRMSKGYARLRRWLILAARTLAIAGLILAVSRPLASGWQGLVGGGQADSTLVLLDRSPSMQESGTSGGGSKLETGIGQLSESLGLLGSNRWGLINGTDEEVVEFDAADKLASLPQARPVGASADLPGMLQSAFDYMQANRPSRTEVWICSDLRDSDWSPEDGRWAELRRAFLSTPNPVRFHLLAYPERSKTNRAIRVTEVRRIESGASAELLLSLKIEQREREEGTAKIPLQIEIDGARSTMTAVLTGTEVEIKSHSIPIDLQQVRGWGKVSLPADANAADNDFYFVYDKLPPRKTLVVTDSPDPVRPLQLAVGIPPEADVVCELETRSPHELIGADWPATSLALWQADLPRPGESPELEAFLQRGGRVIFFPPETPGKTAFAGVQWGAWRELAAETPVSSWIGDQDLLANARSGAALPVGQLQVQRHCELTGDYTSLATLSGGEPLLARAITDQRNVYFCTSTTDGRDSSLARDGVVLYVLLHRALAAGAASLGTARLTVAGQLPSDDMASWKPISGAEEVLSTTYNVQPGVYAVGERLIAINRSAAEDRAEQVEDARVTKLFDQLEFDRVDDRAGSGSSLMEEIWRTFLALMMAALLLEAFLCIPKQPTTPPPRAGAGFATPATSATAGSANVVAAKEVTA
ncbi:MAG: BatA domain-containing protein [Planctomycetaceae bacterium]